MVAGKPLKISSWKENHNNMGRVYITASGCGNKKTPEYMSVVIRDAPVLIYENNPITDDYKVIDTLGPV